MDITLTILLTMKINLLFLLSKIMIRESSYLPTAGTFKGLENPHRKGVGLRVQRALHVAPFIN